MEANILFEEIKKTRNAMRDNFFKKFPDANCAERKIWKSITGYLHNCVEDGLNITTLNQQKNCLKNLQKKMEV